MVNPLLLRRAKTYCVEMRKHRRRRMRWEERDCKARMSKKAAETRGGRAIGTAELINKTLHCKVFFILTRGDSLMRVKYIPEHCKIKNILRVCWVNIYMFAYRRQSFIFKNRCIPVF
eukprot:GEMP01133330.1.p1 GENE.GEMP01133330.1~~GEMP01133330.1.p1  ORF type:complete len:117 (+),score=4.10 GEMP01133330.1:50-400(+)